MAQQSTDPVNHPSHYTSSGAVCSGCGKGIEAIDVTEMLNFNLGNAVKYVWRSDLKGSAVQDLQKAAWYLNREIARLTRLGASTNPVRKDSK